MAQARSVELYEACGVPDTMNGRLEMVLLHVVLALERLKCEGAAGQRLGQRLMEEMIVDMDDALRRLGLGDDSVSGRIPKLAGALAERARDYGADGALEGRLLEHVFRAESEANRLRHTEHARQLAAYVRHSREALAHADGGRLLTGEVSFAAATVDRAATLEQRP